MEIQVIQEKNLDLVGAICLDPSVDQETKDLMEDYMDERICWIRKMMPKGLEILVALEEPRQEEIHYKWVGKMLHSDLAVQGKVPMGLIEYIPIEHALEPVIGKEALFINCMWVLPPFWNTGVGTELVESFLIKAKRYGGASVIAYDRDRWFGTSINYMPSSFFKKLGFKEVERGGSRILMFLNLGSNLEPKLIYPKTKDFNNTEIFNFEIFSNNQCPWSRFMINSIKKELVKYSNMKINVVDTNKRDLIQKLGISRGICLNGIPIIKRMASWEEIKPEIEKYLTEFK